MGRRGRQRAQRTAQEAKAPRDRMARVQVSDETWGAYRAGLGTTPVSVALGDLVRREVGRMGRRSAGDLADARLALDDARQLADELASLIERLELATGAHDDVEPLYSAEPRAWVMRHTEGQGIGEV